MEKIKSGIEVGQKMVIEGRTYWVTEVGRDHIGFMPDPDEEYFGPDNSGRPEYPFWRVFFCILFIAFILKIVF